jgi:hypothetical protein
MKTPAKPTPTNTQAGPTLTNTPITPTLTPVQSQTPMPPQMFTYLPAVYNGE